MPKWLDEAEALAQHFVDRKARARDRLSRLGERNWCFGLLGLSMEPTPHAMEDLAVLRAVEEPPGEVELASVLREKSLLSAVARYSPGFRYELAVYRSADSVDDQVSFTIAWWIVSLLRIRTLIEILVPVAANCSWSVAAAVAENSLEVRLVEDVPRALVLNAPATITGEDIHWVSIHIKPFAKLLESVQFKLAVEALTTHAHQSSLRMTVATLWSGIEALFDVNSELRFRLAMYVDVLLEPRGATRIALFRRIRQLYDVRSKAVHGVKVSDDTLAEHIREVRAVLSRLLSAFIERGSVHSVEELESLALS